MSKELEALNDLRNKCCDYLSLSMDRQVCDSFKLIEAALKEKENIEKTINELFSDNGEVITTIEIKNKLKALDAIKELLCLKVVQLLPNDSDTRLFVQCGAFHISVQIPPQYTSLLKEVLL